MRCSLGCSGASRFKSHSVQHIHNAFLQRSVKLALQALYMLRQIRPPVRPSVCMSVCLSVTRRYCVKTRERRGMWSSPSGSPVSLVFWHQEWLMGERTYLCKIWVQRGGSLCKNSRAVHISPHNSGTVIDSEESSIKANRKSTMGFQTSHQPRSCITLNFPQWGSDTQIWRFLNKCRQTSIKSLLRSFIF